MNNDNGSSPVKGFWIPKKLVQQYDLFVFAQYNNSNTDHAIYYHYGDQVPTSLTFPEEANYQLVSTQNTNFQVRFVNFQPSYYVTNWKKTHLTWSLFSNPDSLTLQPLPFFTAQKSQLLKGVDLSDLKFSMMGLEKATGKAYAEFLNYQFNADRVKKERMETCTGLWRYY